jgi:hypothetical protein
VVWQRQQHVGQDASHVVDAAAEILDLLDQVEEREQHEQRGEDQRRGDDDLRRKVAS